MSSSWLVHGVVREKPRLGPLEEYNGEDIYHPNQPARGQIDEALTQFSGRHVLVVVFDPSGCDSAEDVAEEVKRSVLWSYDIRNKPHVAIQELPRLLDSGHENKTFISQ
jgi:hypothetical protein